MFKLIDLPYEKDALEPYISQETIQYHYWKHHKTYVDNLNKLTVGSDLDNMDLEEVIKNSDWTVYNNAAQIYNHNIYWNCFSPNGWWEPNWEIKEKIQSSFGNFEEFKKAFLEMALKNFGSGWTWLALNEEWKLEIVNTDDGKNLVTTNKKTILWFDIWEHSYYIDYRNDRKSYVEWLWNIINWDFINENLK